MGRTGKKSEGAVRGVATAYEEAEIPRWEQKNPLIRFNNWYFVDGSNQKEQKVIVLDGKKYIAEVGPDENPYSYPDSEVTNNVYLRILPITAANINGELIRNVFGADDMPIVYDNKNANKLPSMYGVNPKTRHERSISPNDELKTIREKANNIIKQLKKCPLCGKYGTSNHAHDVESVNDESPTYIFPIN